MAKSGKTLRNPIFPFFTRLTTSSQHPLFPVNKWVKKKKKSVLRQALKSLPSIHQGLTQYVLKRTHLCFQTLLTGGSIPSFGKDTNVHYRNLMFGNFHLDSTQRNSPMSLMSFGKEKSLNTIKRKRRLSNRVSTMMITMQLFVLRSLVPSRKSSFGDLHLLV